MFIFFFLLAGGAFLSAIYCGIILGVAKFRHRPLRHLGRNALIALAVMVVALVASVASTPSTDLTPAQASSKIATLQRTHSRYTKQETTLHDKATQLTKQKALLLAQVKAAKRVATKAKAQQNATSASLAAVASQKAQAASKRAEAASIAAASSVKAQAASTAAASSRARAASTAASTAAVQQQAQRQTATTHTAPTNAGDTYTGNAQKIIGNANSKIYHVPGQAGYHMSSGNAVYFDSEQQAIAAGYRKSKR